MDSLQKALPVLAVEDSPDDAVESGATDVYDSRIQRQIPLPPRSRETMSSTASCPAHGAHGGCDCVHAGTPFDQTLTEVDFDRGLWAPARGGNVARVRCVTKVVVV